MLGQLLDGVERFLPDIVTFKSQVTSDCETDPQVLDWVPRHHYLSLVISKLKNTEMEKALLCCIERVFKIRQKLIGLTIT